MPTEFDREPGPPQRAVKRERLTRRIALASPRIIAAIAPAGYGKSTVVRQYAETLPSYALCDLAGVCGVVDMAQRVAAALARGDPARERTLAEQRIADRHDPSIWGEFVVKAWSQPCAHRLCVFENAEHMLEAAGCVDFLDRLLSRMPAERQVAICSRQPLPLSLSRFAAPHEIVGLREEALRFAAEEIEVAFAGCDVSPETLDQVARITRGWPVAVLLFARLAREGAVEDALRYSSHVEFADLYDYLAEQVLASLPSAQLMRLVAVAAIPRITGEELGRVLSDPHAEHEVAAAARSSPFMYQVLDGAYEAHPLIDAMLHERYGERCRELLVRAAERLAMERPLRAAELYLEAGDDARAATLLESQYELFVSEMPPHFAELIARLDERIVLEHAGLWAAATAVRSSTIRHQQWLYEALTVRERLTPATTLPTRVGVLTSLGNVLTNLGRHGEALEIFAQLSPPGVELPERYRAIALLFRAAVATRQGRFNDALALWRQAEPLFDGVALTLGIALEEVVGRAARFMQSREVERTLLDKAIALARESRAPSVHALALQEALFGAWLAGEDTLAARYAHELERCVTPSTAKGTEVLRAAVRGDVEPLVRNEGFERPRFRHYAALIACAGAAQAQRPLLARLASEAALEAADATCIVISAVVCAECSAAGERAALTKQAWEQSATIDAPRLRKAVDAYLRGAGDYGILTPLVRRLRGLDQGAPATASREYAVSVADGSVRCNGERLRLSKRERELLLYLALHRRPCSRDELLEAIWPGSAGDAHAVVRVYIARLRARLGAPNAVRLLDSGEYQAASEMLVDLHEVERLVQTAQARPVLTQETRAQLESAAREWSGEAPPLFKRWEWFGPFALRVEELCRKLALLLGDDALKHGRLDEARRMAERAIALDPCDEPARELLIRAALASGDALGAQRELRKYREVLAVELGVEPSRELERLVTETGSGRKPVTGQ